jgi:hypothetical protein
MPTWLYVLACLAVPPIWGYAMYRVFGIWERRRALAGRRPEVPPIDYSI